MSEEDHASTADDHALVPMDNGAMRDPDTGQIAHGPQLTPEQAKALANKRWDDYRAAKAKGMAQGAKTKDEVGAIREVMAKATETAITPGRTQIQAARFVMDEIQQGHQVDTPLGEAAAFEGLAISTPALKVLTEALHLEQARRSGLQQTPDTPID